MSRFIQLHLLTSYPPSCVNRDDLGRPKTAVFGNCQRLRISSQSLKRAWRTSDVFVKALKDHIGTRTRRLGTKVFEDLKKNGIDEKQALVWASMIAAQFGAPKIEKEKPSASLEISQLAHISREELKAVDDLVTRLLAEKRPPKEEELNLIRRTESTVDIAMFGRMMAKRGALKAADFHDVDLPERDHHSEDGAVQVAHALTVHKVQVEDDYFTAVDDLNKAEEERGSGHLGEMAFGAGLFYLNITINCELLLENLGNDRKLANTALSALLEAAATISPTGKQNSFGSHTYASFILAEKGDGQPRNLSVAFLKPISGEDVLDRAIQSLTEVRDGFEKVYGETVTDSQILDAIHRKGSLKALKAFVAVD